MLRVSDPKSAYYSGWDRDSLTEELLAAKFRALYGEISLFAVDMVVSFYSFFDDFFSLIKTCL